MTATADSICSFPTTSNSTRLGAAPGRNGQLQLPGRPGELRTAAACPTGSHSLYHNNGDGTFTDVTRRLGHRQGQGGYGLTVVAADFDNDGWPDIYVACDSTPSLLFATTTTARSANRDLESGVALNEDGMVQAGMGLGIGDFNLDGNLDIFKTHFADDTPVALCERRQGPLSRRHDPIRAWPSRRASSSWGAGIVDLDNDGIAGYCSG